MASNDSDSNSAHRHAVSGLNDARQTVRRFVFELERTSVPTDQLFIDSDNPRHAQKNAHAAVLDYWEELSQPEYTVMMGTLWEATLTDARGREIEVTVPDSDEVEITVTEATGIDSFAPALGAIETTTETVSLEQLAYRWRDRAVTVNAVVDSPYRSEDTRTRSVRVWMPPKLIKAAYSQLTSCLGKIGLLAKTRAPIEQDPDPI